MYTPAELCQMFTTDELCQMFTPAELHEMFTPDGLHELLREDQLVRMKHTLDKVIDEVFGEVEYCGALERGKKSIC
ncbi:hypothetical protein A2U01_0038581 [Trifolium medium]|uniref:Uncharacterized protein n=1 Tax=Trifolium medium TaxID=97028 RepID=A0A392Q034_9FABA|nr:hypothetical protein [Trifolium medium]